jgi:hypothetical protein
MIFANPNPNIASTSSAFTPDEVPDPPTFEEEDDAVIIGGFKISKPFVEKPVDGENHDIYV